MRKSLFSSAVGALQLMATHKDMHGGIFDACRYCMQTVLNLMLKIMASAKTNVPKPMLTKAFDGQYRQL